jgi:hypothetical protein
MKQRTLCAIEGCKVSPVKGDICSIHRAKAKHERAGASENIPGYRRLADEPRAPHDAWAQKGSFNPTGDL